MQLDQVKELVMAHLPDCEVEVGGDGNHIDLTIVGDVFEGMSPVKKQQLVYAGLNEHIASGSIHAVNMKLYTRAEWQKNAE